MNYRRFLCRAGMAFLVILANLGAHSSAPRVTFAGSLDFDAATPGQLVRAVFEAELPSGYHVNSNAPLDEFLKPTRLVLVTPQGVSIDEIVYPEPLLFKTSFSDEPLAVYEHRFLIGASLKLGGNLEYGDHPLTATLRYQACTDKLCYAPASRTTEIMLRVAAEPIPAESGDAGMFDGIGFSGTLVD